MATSGHFQLPAASPTAASATTAAAAAPLAAVADELKQNRSKHDVTPATAAATSSQAAASATATELKRVRSKGDVRVNGALGTVVCYMISLLLYLIGAHLMHPMVFV